MALCVNQNVPCRIYMRYLFQQMENAIREGNITLYHRCRQSDDETSSPELIRFCNVRRMMSHFNYIFNQMERLETMFFIMEDCKQTKNWGRCIEPQCEYCILHWPPQINALEHPHLFPVIKFYNALCNHALTMHYPH